MARKSYEITPAVPVSPSRVDAERSKRRSSLASIVRKSSEVLAMGRSIVARDRLRNLSGDCLNYKIYITSINELKKYQDKYNAINSGQAQNSCALHSCFSSDIDAKIERYNKKILSCQEAINKLLNSNPELGGKSPQEVQKMLADKKAALRVRTQDLQIIR